MQRCPASDSVCKILLNPSLMHLLSFLPIIHAFDFHNSLSLNQLELGRKDRKFSVNEIRQFPILWTEGIKKSFFTSENRLEFCKHHSSARSSSVTNLAVLGREEEQLSLWLENTQVRASLRLWEGRSSPVSAIWDSCHPNGVGWQSGKQGRAATWSCRAVL